MLYNEYELGDTVRLDLEIRVSGTFIDPNYLMLQVTTPAGLLETFQYGSTGTFVKESVGNYYLDYFASQYGQYKYRFFASGTASGAAFKFFVVRRE